MCGEQSRLYAGRAKAHGSPPRVRGTVVVGSTKTPSRGITPACAGNSVHQDYFSGQCQDHPRVCGEQIPAVPEETWTQGSPPRVRGTARLALPAMWDIGITPACAGNREAGGSEFVGGEDHPRVCGEQPLNPRSQPVRLGSPPRVRGTALSCFYLLPQKGITPACAGNRFHLHDQLPCIRDHPRVCGEQFSAS